MNKMYTIDREITFAALKLIEQLYIDHKISRTVYRNIILDYADPEDVKSFCGFREGSISEEGGTATCTESTI